MITSSQGTVRVLSPPPVPVMPGTAIIVPDTTSTTGSVALVPATSVGLIGGTGMTVHATPANLLRGPATFIQDFTIASLDAGTY